MKRGFVFGASIFAVLALCVVWYSLSRPASLTLSRAYAVPNNFTAAAPFDDNSLVVTNGRSLVKYNYTTGQSTPLSPDNPLTGLSNIDTVSVSADKQYILFHQQSAGQGFLYAQLTQKGLDPTLGYWWVYGIAQQTFSPLPQGIVLAKFSANNIDAVAANNGIESLNIYTPSSLASTSSMPIAGASNFFVVNNTYLLQTPDNAILSTSNGVASQTIASSATLVGVDAGTNSAVMATSGQNKALEVINLATNSRHTIAQNVLGQPVIGDGVVMYMTGQAGGSKIPTIYAYNLQTHKNKRVQLPTNLIKVNYSPVLVLNPTTTIISASSGNNYLVGNQLASLQFPGSNYSATVNFTNGSSTDLQYNAQGTQLTADINSNDTAAEATAIYRQLQRDGYNPALIDLSFTVNGGTGDE